MPDIARLQAPILDLQPTDSDLYPQTIFPSHPHRDRGYPNLTICNNGIHGIRDVRPTVTGLHSSLAHGIQLDRRADANVSICYNQLLGQGVLLDQSKKPVLTLETNY
jgi:hypothetical protein